MKLKKYLIYTENYAKGGTNKYLIDYINAMPNVNNIIVISNKNGIFPDELSQINKNITYKQFVILSLHKQSFFNNYILNSLTRKILSFLSLIYNFLFFLFLLIKIKPDYIHIFNGGLPGGLSCLSLSIAARAMKIKNFMTIVSLPLLKEHYLIIKLYTYIALHSSNGFIVNSNSIKNELVKNCKITSNKIFLIYNGLNIAHSGNKERFKEYFHQNYNYNFDADNKIITCVGRFDELKGQKHLISALNILNSSNKNYKYKMIFVGKGPLLNDMINYSKKLNLEKFITFIEYYPFDIYDILDCSNIFVFPSLHEGFSYALLEAMKSKCAIIATNICGNVEMIDNNVNGFLVSPASDEEIALKLSAYLNSDELINIHSQMAFEKFKNLFSDENFKKNVNNFVNSFE